MRIEIIIIIIIIILFAAIGCSLGGSRPYVDTSKESLYIRGTIQNKVHTINKVHTVQMQTYKVTQGRVIHLSSNLILFASLHSDKVTSHYFTYFHLNRT
jgi:hypothetical protein